MSGSGTDKTKSGVELRGPVVILVEPQLGENIGMTARAMGNFALTRLRIVNPRDGWPNVSAQRAAAGADAILDRVELFDSVEQAVADLTLLFATTARAHDQAKPVVAPEVAAREIVAGISGGGKVGILFGRERYGLQNEEVALADRIITFPVNPGFASLNLAQAVLLMGYEWFKLSTAGALPFAMPERSERASQHQMQAFFDNLVRELDRVEFLRPAEKRETMLVNLRNIFSRMEPTKQDMHTLHGVVMAIAEGRKGPAKGGVLDGEQATRLRALLAEHGQAALPSRKRHRARAGAAAAAKPDRRRADPVAGADDRPPLRRTVQAPDPGRAAHSGFRVVRVSARDRTHQSGRDRCRRPRPRGAAGMAGGTGLPGPHHGRRRGRSPCSRRTRPARLRSCQINLRPAPVSPIWYALYVPTSIRRQERPMKRSDLTEKLLDIKREKGWSWKHICEKIGGYSEVLIVGAILGQMKLTKPQAANAGELFGLSKSETAMLNEVPHRGVPMPPTDPVIYRFYELVMLNGPAWKALIEEEFGDGIMSAIDFEMALERLPNPKGDRVKITMSGKFLPYKYYGASGNIPEYGFKEE